MSAPSLRSLFSGVLQLSFEDTRLCGAAVMRNGESDGGCRSQRPLLGVFYLVPLIYYEVRHSVFTLLLSPHFCKLYQHPAPAVHSQVSGGPVGVEGSVGAGGPLLAIAGFLIFPLLWSLPEALLTTELACAFPENSGYVAWVSAAFGNRIGFVEGTLSWLSGVADNSVYPLLFLEYLNSMQSINLSATSQWLAATVLCMLLSYLNWRGLHIVGRTAVGLCLSSLLPFFVLVVLGTPKVDLSRFNQSFDQQSLKDVNWTYLLNVLFWNLNYWDSISTLAGEVNQPEKTFPPAVGLACLLVTLCYTLPLAIGIGATTDDLKSWDEGHLAVAAGDIVGPWLRWWVIAAAAASNIGMFEAEMSSDSYQLLGMAQRGMLPKTLAQRSEHGTPTFAIVLSSLGVVLLAALSFEQVLELLNFLYCIAALLEFASFVKLRHQRSELFSTFKLPLPTPVISLMLVPPASMILLVMSLASSFTYIVAGLVMALGLFGYSIVEMAKKNNWCAFNTATESWSSQDLEQVICDTMSEDEDDEPEIRTLGHESNGGLRAPLVEQNYGNTSLE